MGVDRNIPDVQDRGVWARLLLALLLGAGAMQAFSQEPADTTFQRYVLAPFVTYSEETGAQLGVLSMLFARPTVPGEPGDMLTATGVVTTGGQKLLLLGPGGTLAHGAVRYGAFLKYSQWPGKYWKGGNAPEDTAWGYDMENVGLSGNLLFSAGLIPGISEPVGKSLRAGFAFDLEHSRTSFDRPDSVTGLGGLARGGLRTGIGPKLQWDTRDHQGAPSRGVLLAAERTWYRSELGGDRDFGRSNLDLRAYRPLWGGTVLALGAFWEEVDGDAPFDKLAMPDGVNRLRGLSKGRLRDRQQLSLQSEVRFPIAWRFSGTAFAEAAKVGRDLDALRDNGFHTSLGGGIRFAVNPRRKLNFRTDVAWVDGGIGAAASFGEAF